MEFHRKHSVCFLLLGMLFCTAGCTATEQDSTAEKPKKMTDLPPLVTEISTEDTTAEISTETTLVTEEAELPEPVYQAKVTAWELPEELGSLQAVRVYQNTVYLLGVRQNAAQQSESVLYCVSEDAESAEPVFTPLYPNSNASDFVGLTDFDVLSDGTICGLLCENADAVPYDSTPTISIGNLITKTMPLSISWYGMTKMVSSAKSWDFPHCWIWMKPPDRRWHLPVSAVTLPTTFT